MSPTTTWNPTTHLSSLPSPSLATTRSPTTWNPAAAASAMHAALPATVAPAGAP